MPMIRISRMNGQLVWEGEGELVLGPRPGQPTNLLADGVIIRQEERRDGEVRSRQLAITGLMQTTPAEYRISYASPPPTVSFDPSGDAWVLGLPEPPPVQLYELRAEFPPGMAEWLHRALEAPLETPEERRTRERALHEARLAAWRDPGVPVSELMQSGAPPRAGITFDDIRDDLRRHRRPEPTMAELDRWAEENQREREEAEDRWGLARALYENQARLLTPADVAEAFGLDPELVSGPADEVLRRQRAEQDELITSTRAEFPHDPYDYGRIYPGDRGTSRWTPPADPNEKIRSCP